MKRIWTPRYQESPKKKDTLKWCRFGQHIWIAYKQGVRLCAYCGTEKKIKADA